MAAGLRSNPQKREELQNIITLLEQKKLKSIIDIAEAQAYVETGRKRGSVIVHIGKE